MSQRTISMLDPRHPPRHHLPTLTGLRFLAAGMVVCHHLLPAFIAHRGIRSLVSQGYTGVGFFFVLSGFVLGWSWRHGDRYRDFWSRRFARVYPLHALTWIAAYVFLAAIHALPSLTIQLLSLFLLQAWVPDRATYYGMNALSWSLSCEAAFYLVFPALMPLVARARRSSPMVPLAAILAVGASISLILHLTVDNPELLHGLLYANPAFRLVEFSSGMVLANAMRAGWRVPFGPWVAIGAVVGLLIVCTGLNAHLVTHGTEPSALGVPVIGLPRDVGDLIMLPGWIALVGAGATSDLSGHPTRLSMAWLVRLGQWSFALYLSHQLFVRILQRSVSPRGLVGGGLICLLVAVTAVAISGLLFVGFERPVERRLRRRLLRHAPLEPAP
jgi:peptidoglycan/LPS O-acetylase OafA/YrhL